MKVPASSLDGVLTTKYLDTVDDTDNAWIKLWQKVWEQEGDGEPLTNYRVYGMAQAYTFVQALQAAGKDLTRQGIVDAIEEQGGDFSGPVLAPFAYSSDSHMGTTGMRVVSLKGATTVPETEVAGHRDRRQPGRARRLRCRQGRAAVLGDPRVRVLD